MQNINSNLEFFINHFRFKEEPPSPNKNNHIYYNIEKLVINNKISIEKKMKMFYIFSLNESCLSLFRKRRINEAENLFLYLNKLDINIDSTIDYGMLSLHNAMAAYRDYVYQNCSEAEIKLQKAISYSISQSKTIPRFLIALQDQWLNRIRNIIKTNFDEGKLKKECLLLLSFNYNGVFGETNYLPILKNNSKIDLESSIRANFNQLLKMLDDLSEKGKINKNFYNSFFKDLNETVMQYDNRFEYGFSRTISILNRCYASNNIFILLDELKKNIDLINNSPLFIKKKIVSQFIKIVNENKIDTVHYRGYTPFVEIIRKELQIENIPKSVIHQVQKVA